MNQEDFFNEIADLVKNQPSNIVFFVGAGISIKPPSSLPLSNNVKSELVKAICKIENETSINQFFKSNNKEIMDYIDKIFMESIFEIIRTQSDFNILNIITNIFNIKEFNDNHIFLAKSVIKGCRIITTNFDMLIEEALKNENKKDSSFMVDHIVDNINHIHGSVNDLNSIIVTLKQVGQGIITDKIEKELKELLNDKFVVFIGWSDADIDITSALFLSSIKRIFWIDHSSKDDEITIYNNKNKEKYKKPIDKLIGQFGGVKYTGNSDYVIKELWKRLWPGSPKCRKNDSSAKWKCYIKKIEEIEEKYRIFILLEILERIDPIKELAIRFISNLEDCSSDFIKKDKSIYYELKCKKSVCLRIISKYKESIISAEEGLCGIMKSGLHLSWYIELRNDIASAFNDWAQERIENKSFNVVLKKQLKAIKIFEKNLRILDKQLSLSFKSKNEQRREACLLLDKAQVHTNLGSTYLDLYKNRLKYHYQRKENWFKEILNRAEINYLKGIEIHEQIEDLKDEALINYNEIKLGDLYNNIANLYCLKKMNNKAKDFYDKCYLVKKKCGDVKGLKRLLNDYLPVTDKNDINKSEINSLMNKQDILDDVFVEHPITSTHLLYYKKDLLAG